MEIKIGNLIRMIRAESKLTQKSFAKKLGVATMSIHSYENNKRVPGLIFYQKLIKHNPEYLDKIFLSAELPIGKKEQIPEEGRINTINVSKAKLLLENNELLKDKIKSLEQKIEKLDLHVREYSIQSKLKREKRSHIDDNGKVLDPNGQPFDQIIAQIEDATSRWNWAFTHNPTPMVIDRHNILMNVNTAWLNQFGYKSASDVQNKPILDFVHPDDLDRVKKELKRKNTQIKFRNLKGNGHYCTVNIDSKVFTDAFENTYSVAHVQCEDDNCKDV